MHSAHSFSLDPRICRRGGSEPWPGTCSSEVKGGLGILVNLPVYHIVVTAFRKAFLPSCHVFGGRMAVAKEAKPRERASALRRRMVVLCRRGAFASERKSDGIVAGDNLCTSGDRIHHHLWDRGERERCPVMAGVQEIPQRFILHKRKHYPPQYEVRVLVQDLPATGKSTYCYLHQVTNRSISQNIKQSQNRRLRSEACTACCTP